MQSVTLDLPAGYDSRTTIQRVSGIIIVEHPDHPPCELLEGGTLVRLDVELRESDA